MLGRSPGCRSLCHADRGGTIAGVVRLLPFLDLSEGVSGATLASGQTKVQTTSMLILSHCPAVAGSARRASEGDGALAQPEIQLPLVLAQ